MFRGIEHRFQMSYRGIGFVQTLFGHPLLDALGDYDVTSVGCPVHRDTMTA